VVEAVRRYVGEVQSRAFPAPEHAFKSNEPDGALEPPAPDGGTSDLRH
jgi:hypothetical protein